MRALPRDEMNELLTKLNLSRIESTRGYYNNNSHGELPSSENPFNPILSYDVNYTQPRLSQTNRVLTKYENHTATPDNNIALYNTRTYSLNAEEQLGGLKLHNDQMERAKSKIQQRHSDLIPKLNTEAFYNGNIYNPQLPISETNKPVQNPYPAQVDERLIWHTNDREFKYPSDIANDAYNNQRDPALIERNRRQQEADDALLKRHRLPRYVEAKMAYHDRPFKPNYSLNEFTKHDASKQNDRQTLSNPATIERMTAKTRDLTPEESMNKLKPEVNQEFQPLYSQHAIKNHIKNINDRRDPKNKSSHDANTAWEGFNSKNGIVDKVFETITEGFNLLFGRHEQTGIDNRYNDRNASYDNINDNENVAEGFPLNVTIGTKENYIFKPKHILVKNFDVSNATFSDEEFDNTASSLISLNPFDSGLVRTLVIVEDGKFKILQKYNNDAIFSNDNRPFGEDFLLIDVPIENVDKNRRERIKTLNMNSKRDKTLELDYIDLSEFKEYALEHPEVGVRIKFQDIWKKVRGNALDEDAINSFGSKKVFIEDGVIDKIKATERKEQHRLPGQGRINRDQPAQTTQDNLNIQTPFKPSAVSSGESYRNLQQNDTPFATTRTTGVRMKQFNS